MEICIVTNDNVIARCLCLELEEAGFLCEQKDMPCGDALLNIIDLDAYNGEIPPGSIGFSYNDACKSLVPHFLPRPISVSALISTVSERVSKNSFKSDATALTLEKSSRKIRTPQGEVRLSEKELALLLKLKSVETLSREEAILLFGDGDSNVVDVYMHYLRKKLKAVCPYDVIKSKRGEGYSLVYEIKSV